MRINRITRRKQLALFLCCGVAGLSAEAMAQSATPLRVDPALLGLPPLKSESPARLETPAGRDSAAEAKPVEPEKVETQPLPVPAPEAAPPVKTAEPPGTAPVPPVSAPPSAPKAPVAAPAPSSGTDREPASRTAETGQEPVREPTAASRASSPAPHVDPALLGQPPTVPSPQASRRPEVTAGPGQTPPSPAFGPSPAFPPAESGVEDAGPALSLHASPKMVPLSKDGEDSRPAFLSADRMSGEVNREFNAEGNAELRKIGTVVTSDRQTYWPLEDEVEAEGNVHLWQGNDTMSGPKLRLRLEDRVGYFEQPTYFIKRQPIDREKAARPADGTSSGSWWNSGFATVRALNIEPGQTTFKESTKAKTSTDARGEAERIDFEGENHYTLFDNIFTTCPVGNDDWYVRTDELKLDYDVERGEGRNATVYFKDVPFFYTPWLSFSLNNERKSGFLMPTFGTSSGNGFEYTQPYYWNIAPNMDATISPRVMTKRGLQVGGEFRYLNLGYGGSYDGTLKGEILPSDRLYDSKDRYGISLLHNQTTGNGFSGLINYSKVSDDDYYTDLSSGINSTSQTQLLQQGMLTYGRDWWSTSVNFQQYQTLQPDKDNPVLDQYRMLPQITFNGRRPDFYKTDVTLYGQYTNFTMREREQFGTIYPDGKRTVLYPQVSLPFVTPGWYVTPKVGVNYRGYSLSGQASDKPDSVSVTLPIYSIDSGMTFERNSNWFGRDYTQTLEPRLYYVYIPYKDQSDIPLFDTGLADFNFAQIFSENQFSSWDRINNASQLTAAVTSRLIEPSTGNEIMRAMLGQRYYFTKNKVSLSGAAINDENDKWERSDVLAAFSGQILPKVYADTAVQYSVNDRSTKRYSLGVRYNPEAGKVLNAAYRYNVDPSAPVDQVDISGQWPLWGRWHGVGRINYSFKDDGNVLSTNSQGARIIESLAGLEYNGGCWVLRGVVHRQALTSKDTSTSFFIQLELNDFARVGSNPLNLLKRNIQGYSLINDPNAESMFND